MEPLAGCSRCDRCSFVVNNLTLKVTWGQCKGEVRASQGSWRSPCSSPITDNRPGTAGGAGEWLVASTCTTFTRCWPADSSTPPRLQTICCCSQPSKRRELCSKTSANEWNHCDAFERMQERKANLCVLWTQQRLKPSTFNSAFTNLGISYYSPPATTELLRGHMNSTHPCAAPCCCAGEDQPTSKTFLPTGAVPQCQFLHMGNWK